MIHELKILPEYFEAASTGKKKFELRRNYRNYKIDDILILREWTGEEYTGRTVSCKVSYILSEFSGLDPDYVIMSIDLLQ